MVAQDQTTFVYQVSAARARDVNNDALVQSTTNDPDLSNNQSQSTVTFVEPDINVIMAENGDFGDLCEDDHKDLNITVRNQGGGDLIISSITSDNPNNFKIVPNLQYPLVIKPGKKLEIPIRFDPDNAENCSDTVPRTANITIVSNDPDEPNNVTAVMGKVLCPNLVMDPPDLTGLFAFPPTVTDTGGNLGCFSDQTVTITNDGFCPLKISGITTTDPSFVVIDPTVFPIVLQPNVDQLIVTVRFAPVAGGPVNVPDETLGILQVNSNDPDPADTMADLCGEPIGEQAGLRVLGVEKTSGLPVDILDSIKLKRGANLVVKETNVPLKDTLICGNQVLYHFHREQLLPKTYKVIAKKKIGEHPYGGDIILRGKKKIPLDPCQFEELVLKMKQIDP
jgi:hypothetical protein